jgi:hypothetical protein
MILTHQSFLSASITSHVVFVHTAAFSIVMVVLMRFMIWTNPAAVTHRPGVNAQVLEESAFYEPRWRRRRTCQCKLSYFSLELDWFFHSLVGPPASTLSNETVKKTKVNNRFFKTVDKSYSHRRPRRSTERKLSWLNLSNEKELIQTIVNWSQPIEDRGLNSELLLNGRAPAIMLIKISWLMQLNFVEIGASRCHEFIPFVSNRMPFRLR